MALGYSQKEFTIANYMSVKYVSMSLSQFCSFAQKCQYTNLQAEIKL